MIGMKTERALLLILSILLFGGFQAMAQNGDEKDANGSYCNVFYVKSGNPEILPFEDVCFVVDRYTLDNPRHFRALGPINGHIDLFRQHDWVMDFYLPEVREAERVTVATPKDFLAKNLEMKAGQIFLTIGDNRGTGKYDPVTDRVDFVSVGGRATVISFKAQGEGMEYAEYEMQMDLRMQKVDRSGDYPKLTGDQIRLRMVLIVEALD